MMRRRTRCPIAVLLLALAPAARTQTPPAAAQAKPPAYDVSTIKPASKDATGRDSMFDNGRYTAANLTMRDLLRTAFGLQDELIAELPPWAEKQRFDIEAKSLEADEETLKSLPGEQKREMLRRLLEDRFQLKWHKETRPVPVYELIVAKGGSKMEIAPPGGKGSGVHGSRAGELAGINCPTSVLATVLSEEVHRVVLDKTALPGRYNFTLKFTRDDAPPGPAEQAPGIFTAIQEQLGLKLQPARGPAQVLVVDSVSQPSTD